MNKKIININQLKITIRQLKKKKKKIVLCHGVFDLLHTGHIMHFQESKKLGDILVVSVTPNIYVKKGPNRPVMDIRQRMQIISEIDCVDFVVENFKAEASSIIKVIKPNIYSKGLDYKNNKDDITGKILEEKKTVQKNGGKIHYTKSKLYSSSKLINDLAINLDNKQKNYLIKLKSQLQLSKISFEEHLDSLKKLKVLIIGEAIIDKYVFCEAVGKSGKEPMLVLRDLKSQKYIGGSLAIAKSISFFCQKVSILTYLGSKKNELKFMKNNLPKNIDLDYVIKENSPSVLKTRYIEHINSTKILGVYSYGVDKISKKNENALIKKLRKKIKNYDVVIVSDYGHGLITEKLSKFIMKNSKFLSVNAQLNATNLGYHTISKYNLSDLLIINENELRHEMRDKESNLDYLIIKLSKNIKTKYIVVTSGSEGAKLFISKNKKIINCPAFTYDFIDKVGAGDTLLSLLSISIKKSESLELSMLIASLAAAQNVKSLANSSYISDIEMKKNLKSYLK